MDTNSQTSNMNIKFIASPPYFHGERSAMSMPSHREGSKVKERSNGATKKRSRSSSGPLKMKCISFRAIGAGPTYS